MLRMNGPARSMETLTGSEWRLCVVSAAPRHSYRGRTNQFMEETTMFWRFSICSPPSCARGLAIPRLRQETLWGGVWTEHIRSPEITA